MRTEAQDVLEQLYSLTLLAYACFIRLIGLAERRRQLWPNRLSETRHQFARVLSMLVLRKADSQPELGIFFEQ